jgi:hypothetical protein
VARSAAAGLSARSRCTRCRAESTPTVVTVSVPARDGWTGRPPGRRRRRGRCGPR